MVIRKVVCFYDEPPHLQREFYVQAVNRLICGGGDSEEMRMSNKRVVNEKLESLGDNIPDEIVVMFQSFGYFGGFFSENCQDFSENNRHSFLSVDEVCYRIKSKGYQGRIFVLGDLKQFGNSFFLVIN